MPESFNELHVIFTSNTNNTIRQYITITNHTLLSNSNNFFTVGSHNQWLTVMVNINTSINKIVVQEAYMGTTTKDSVTVYIAYR